MDNEYNFPVALMPIETKVKVPEGITLNVDVPKYRAVVRTDTNKPLGVVSNRYELLKHDDVITGFRRALSGMDVAEKISVQNDGAKLFAHYRLNAERVEVKEGDMVALQFVVKNSYDGSNALQIMLGAYRLVCDNGMVIGKQFYTYSQKHIGSGVDVGQLSERVGAMVSAFKDTLPTLQAMTQRNNLMTVEELFDYNKLIMPNYLADQARTEYIREGDTSVWGYYNALTYAITHGMKKQNSEAAINFGKMAWSQAQELLKS